MSTSDPLKPGDHVLACPDRFDPFVVEAPHYAEYPEGRRPYLSYVVVRRAGLRDEKAWKYPKMTSVVEVPLRYVTRLLSSEEKDALFASAASTRGSRS